MEMRVGLASLGLPRENVGRLAYNALKM